uniref:Uncharacterized protein n=1 Tax=Sinocyclocheilus grahami TaxID=75366 RepID=A0A672NCM3_SINGR
IEAIISAAETGFTGSFVGSSIPCRPTAYIGTITGCFLWPILCFPITQLTMFLVSIPSEQSSALLALLTSCSCCQTFRSALQNPQEETESVSLTTGQ